MRSTWTREPRSVWSFWAAAGLVAIGGAVPFAIGGQSSRISSVFIPFAVAALAFAACALVHEQGRGLTSVLYLVAGLAIVYGILTMFALPLMLAVLGTCPAPPAQCATGLQRPLTISENTGIGVAAVLGLVALFVGFIGLAVVYRRTAPPKVAPPVRTIPPVESTREAEAPEAPAAPAEAEATDKAEPPVAEAAAHEPEARAELPAPEDEPELPAPEEPLELPAHESETPKT